MLVKKNKRRFEGSRLLTRGLSLASLFVLAYPQIADAKTTLEELLNSETGYPDYAERIHRLTEESERAIVHAGIGAMMLMNLIDDEIGFGDSEYWDAPIGTRGSSSIACALGGGIEATATRDDYREVSGSLTFNNCLTTLGRISGSATFSHDDAVWLDQSNPKIQYALTMTLANVQIESRDGRTYQAASGTAYCDSDVNHPLQRYKYDPVTGYVTEYAYGRDPDRPLLSQYENFNGYTYGNDGWEVEDASGLLKENVIEQKWSCDIKNTVISVGGQEHFVNDLKFSSSYVYGDTTQANYHVSNGRTDRLAKIGSGDATPRRAGAGGSFRHAEFGELEVVSGQRNWGDWASQVVNDDRYPAGFRIDIAFYRNSYGGENWWSLDEGRLVGGDNNLTLPDLDEDGSSGGYEVIDSGFYLRRQNCALDAIGNRVGTDYFERSRVDVPEIIRDLRSVGGCFANNHWFVVSELDGTFVQSYQFDDDGDGIDKYYDEDDDNDGVEDASDAFPEDSSETADTDFDGIGNNADTDDDNDGVADTNDAFPLDASESKDTDGDGIGNNADPDDDGDGYRDNTDAFPLDSSEWLDTDGDGLGNNADKDDDNDGLTDRQEKKIGTNRLLADTDGDSMDDGQELENDLNPTDDSDCPNWYCLRISPVILLTQSGLYDFDGDGLTKEEEEALGSDYRSADTDGDGLIDGEEVTAGSNPLVLDTDGDGLSDGLEIELGTSPIMVDSDGDSMSDGEEVGEDLDPVDSSDCPKWYCGGGVLPFILGTLE